MFRIHTILSFILLSITAKAATDQPKSATDQPKSCDTTGTCVDFTVAIIGAGRMGTHLAATYADAGIDVSLLSRDPTKSLDIITALLSGNGWEKKGIQLPPSTVTDTSHWTLKSGGYAEAVNADVIVLAVPFRTNYRKKWYETNVIEVLKPIIGGHSKYIVDINNPWIIGTGLPAEGPQSSVEVNAGLMDDATAKWCAGYKTIFWHDLLPGRKKNHIAKNSPVEIAGEVECKKKLSMLIQAHGFNVKDEGGFEKAKLLEWMFNSRTRRPVRVHSRDRMMMDGF